MDELLFKYLPIELSIKQPFGLLNRGGDTVVALVRNSRGQWVLGEKNYLYPQGISRMVGGGMEGDNPLPGIQREVKEELGIDVDEERLQPLVHAEIVGHLPEGKDVTASVFVFYVSVPEVVAPADDLTGLAYLSDKDMADLVERYAQLPDEPLIRKNEPDSTWRMYGKVWGPIHAAALERVKELGI